MLMSIIAMAGSVLIALLLKSCGETDVTVAVGMFIFGFIGFVSSFANFISRKIDFVKNKKRENRF